MFSFYNKRAMNLNFYFRITLYSCKIGMNVVNYFIQRNIK